MVRWVIESILNGGPYFTFQPLLHEWCNKGRGMCFPVSGMFYLNSTLNTFYLRLYCIVHMVEDHSDSERGNPLLSHGLLFLINSKGSFISTIP